MMQSFPVSVTDVQSVNDTRTTRRGCDVEKSSPLKGPSRRTSVKCGHEQDIGAPGAPPMF